MPSTNDLPRSNEFFPRGSRNARPSMENENVLALTETTLKNDGNIVERINHRTNTYGGVAGTPSPSDGNRRNCVCRVGKNYISNLNIESLPVARAGR